MTELELKAIIFAHHKHAEAKQFRKYDNEPYINHPMRVANTVRSVSHTPEMLAAAWLHDTVEDTNTTLSDIYTEFGEETAKLVEMLTDVAKSSDGNRITRSSINLQHTAVGNASAHTIKLADLIDNSASIIKYDRHFAKVYMVEKQLLLDVLSDGDAILHNKAKLIVDNYNESNNSLQLEYDK